MAGKEIGLQLGTSQTFRVVIYDPATGDEIAADSPPTFEILDATMTSVFGPTASVLVGGTTGTYDITVSLLNTWTEGQFIGEWGWTLSTGAFPFNPRFTFHAHLVVLP